MHSMPVLSLVYFRNLSLLSETCKARCLDVNTPSVRNFSNIRLSQRVCEIPTRKFVKWPHSKLLPVPSNRAYVQNVERLFTMLATINGCCVERPLHPGDQVDSFT